MDCSKRVKFALKLREYSLNEVFGRTAAGSYPKLSHITHKTIGVIEMHKLSRRATMNAQEVVPAQRQLLMHPEQLANDI